MTNYFFEHLVDRYEHKNLNQLDIKDYADKRVRFICQAIKDGDFFRAN